MNLPAWAQSAGLLVISNVFMTFAWYAHLKELRHSPWIVAALVSWGIAFFEYCLRVPANRWGNNRFSAIELKILQEVITLAIFSGFVIAYLGERVRWNHLAAFVCIVAAVAFAFLPGKPDGQASPGDSSSTTPATYSQGAGRTP